MEHLMIIGSSSSKLLVWGKSMFQNQCKTMPARHMLYHLKTFLFLSEFIDFDYNLNGLRVTLFDNTHLSQHQSLQKLMS